MTTAQPAVPTLLAGRVAIVTGASRGIGAATARACTAAGAAVVLAARDESALQRLAENLRADGGRATVVPTDVSEATAVEELVRRTVEEYGRLDIAVNNAAGGGHRPTPIEDVALADFDSAVATTLRGTFVCLQHEIAAMLDGGHGGAIVNVSSTAGLQGVGGLSAYVATKHAVIGLTRTAALDHAADGIRVNAVAPGPILTERLAAAGEQARQGVARAVPTGRVGRVEEVAATVVWLCSDAASFVTGAVVPIDGGRLAGPPLTGP